MAADFVTDVTNASRASVTSAFIRCEQARKTVTSAMRVTVWSCDASVTQLFDWTINANQFAFECFI